MPFQAIVNPAAAPNIQLGAPLTEVGLTLDDIRNRVIGSLAGRTDLDKIRIDEWINEAYIDVATSLDLPEVRFMLQLNLVASQPFYSLPDNIDYTTNALIQLPESVSFREGQILDKIDLEQYRKFPELGADVTAMRLEPQAYLVYQGTLIVYPTPWTARTLVLDGAFIPQPLTLDTDSPVLTREWHRAIVLKARAMILADNADAQGAMLAENNYIRYVQARSNRRALEKTNRFASASFPGRKTMHYDSDQSFEGGVAMDSLINRGV